MYRSWSNPLTIAYEVKVTRSDFLRDDKWRAYLAYCNEFYFVSPHGVIHPEDLPAEAGLIHVSSTGSKLFIKKRAARRTVEIPEDLFRYLLMCRTKVTRETYDDPRGSSPREVWRSWLAQEAADRHLGYNVSRGIREALAVKMDKVERDNRELREQIKGYERLRGMLTSLGLDPETDYSHWVVKNRLEDLKRVVPQDLDQLLDRTLDAAQRFRKELDALKEVQPAHCHAAAAQGM